MTSATINTVTLNNAVNTPQAPVATPAPATSQDASTQSNQAPYGDNSSAKWERFKVKALTRSLKVGIAGAAAVNMASALHSSGALDIAHGLLKENLKNTVMESWPDVAMESAEQVAEFAEKHEGWLTGVEALGDPLMLVTEEFGKWAGGQLAQIDHVRQWATAIGYQDVLAMYPQYDFNFMALAATSVILGGYAMYRFADNLGRDSYADTIIKADKDNAVMRAREGVPSMLFSGKENALGRVGRRVTRIYARDNALNNAHSPHAGLGEITRASVMWKKMGPDSRSMLVRRMPFLSFLSNPRVTHESMGELIAKAKLPMPFDHYLEREVNLLHLAALVGQDNSGPSVTIKAMDLFRNPSYTEIFQNSEVIVKELAHRVDDLKLFAERSYQALGPLAEHIFKNEKRLKGTLQVWDKLTMKAFADTIQDVALDELIQFGMETVASYGQAMSTAVQQHQAGVPRELAEEVLDKLDRIVHAKPDSELPAYNKLMETVGPLRDGLRVLVDNPNIQHFPRIPINQGVDHALLQATAADSVEAIAANIHQVAFQGEHVLTVTSTQEAFINKMEATVRENLEANYTQEPGEPSIDDMMYDYRFRVAASYAVEPEVPRPGPAP